MQNSLPLKVSGVIFLVVALVHLSRLVFPFQIIIGGFSVPVGFSVAIGVAILLLAVWILKSIK